MPPTYAIAAAAALFLVSGAASVEPSGSLTAALVKPGATVCSYTARNGDTVSGFFIRLTNCVGPREEPVVAAIRVHGELLPARVHIPAFPFPLVKHTRGDRPGIPPLDVGQEFRAAIPPVTLKEGEEVRVEIVSAESLVSGVTAGLQLQGRHALAEMRNPFRESRTAGPVSRIPWEPPEIIAAGNQQKFDPQCAPQNNSSIVSDADGTLFQFTAYYSVDEQYGGGRGGSYSRIFGFRKAPGSDRWEQLGLIVDLHKEQTYSGDPFAFRDLNGTPCLVYTVADGTNGFADWKRLGAFLRRSTTNSFAGPWGEPHAFFENYPREPDDNKTGGRANCIRIYSREKTRDYVFVWTHGAQDMDIRGVILPDLNATLTHEQIGSAPVLVRNQDEGGGGFQFGEKGYLSTWQIPWVNDPTGIQRVYEFDLADALNPEAWRIVPGSLGMNDGSTAYRDGGCTADSWAVSLVGNELWATSCEWSVSDKKNYLLARRASAGEASLFRGSGVFRYGAVCVDGFHEVVPVIEYAVGKECAFEMTFIGTGLYAYAFLMLAPSDAALYKNSLCLEVSSSGSRLVAYRDDADPIPLTSYQPIVWESGKPISIKLIRRDAELTGLVDGQTVGPATISGSDMLQWLDQSPRFKLYGWKGSGYSIAGAVLTDGPQP